MDIEELFFLLLKCLEIEPTTHILIVIFTSCLLFALHMHSYSYRFFELKPVAGNGRSASKVTQQLHLLSCSNLEIPRNLKNLGRRTCMGGEECRVALNSLNCIKFPTNNSFFGCLFIIIYLYVFIWYMAIGMHLVHALGLTLFGGRLWCWFLLYPGFIWIIHTLSC